MWRNPEDRLEILKNELLLGNTSVVEALWHELVERGLTDVRNSFLSEQLQLLDLCGENPPHFNYLTGWVDFLTEQDDILYLREDLVRIPGSLPPHPVSQLVSFSEIYAVFIAYAAAAAVAEYYAQELEIIESFPASSDGWHPSQDIQWRSILEEAKNQIISAINLGSLKMRGFTNLRKYITTPDRAGELTTNEVGRSYVSKIFNKVLDMDRNKQFSLRKAAKAVCESVLELARLMINRRDPNVQHAEGSCSFIDIGRIRVQEDIGDLFSARSYGIPCHVQDAYHAYTKAISAFTGGVLSEEQQDSFDIIWRRNLKELFLLLDLNLNP